MGKYTERKQRPLVNVFACRRLESQRRSQIVFQVKIPRKIVLPSSLINKKATQALHIFMTF